MGDKSSHYVCQSPAPDGGYYLLISQDYDKSLKIIHTLREKKIMKMVRNIDPDILKVLDFFVIKKKKHAKTPEGYQRVEIRLLMMRDDEFLFDFIEFDEKLIPGDVEKLAKLALPPKEFYDYQNLVRRTCVTSAIRAYSSNWPYFSCAGFANYLMLVNVFDSKLIQKI